MTTNDLFSDIPDPHLDVHGRPVEPLLALEPGVAAGHDQVRGAARLVCAKHKLTAGNLKINVFKYLCNFTTNQSQSLDNKTKYFI